jgi:NtrC-family two-component system response regulator AlgB
MPPLGTRDAPTRVLVIDDVENIRATLAVCLEQIGCEVSAAASAAEALDACRRGPFDLAFLDLRLGADTGLDLLPQILAECPGVAVVVITAYASFDTAVEAVRRGAADYIPKPFTPDQIRLRVEQLTQRRALAHRMSELEDELRRSVPEVELETRSARMRAVLETLTRAAASDAAVLLTGESGTGKTILARALHARSRRAARPFVVVNCPTLSAELLTSELFGHARGAFTGAIREREGRVEAAHGGTLFLDEVSEIEPGLQSKLLRFLQDRTFERVGENRTRLADVRVVAATNRDLAEEVRAGRFREDLLYRINVLEIAIPPLRERPEDVLPLARAFLAFFARSSGRPVPELSPDAEQTLARHPWPGNVRELRNAIERALILWPTDVIGPEAFTGRVVGGATGEPFVGGRFTLDDVEREHIRTVIGACATLDEAAAVLGIEPSTLWRKRKRYGL